MRRVHSKTTVVKSIAEGRKVLEAAWASATRTKSTRATSAPMIHAVREEEASEAGRPRIDEGRRALIVTTWGWMVSRGVAERLMFGVGGEARVAARRQRRGLSAGDKIRAAARWLQDNCERPISVVDAAQVAAMSERTFPAALQDRNRALRHPTICCRRSLPSVRAPHGLGAARRQDRAAQRHGQRQSLGEDLPQAPAGFSPTEYRMQSRRDSGS